MRSNIAEYLVRRLQESRVSEPAGGPAQCQDRRAVSKVLIRSASQIVPLAIRHRRLYIFSIHRAHFRTSFLGGNEAVRIGSFAIDSKDRIFWWTLFWESFLKALIFGHGPGGFQTQLFLDVQRHKYHLRLLHDLGIAGYALRWPGTFGALLMNFRGWRMAAGPYHREAVLMISSFLFIGAFITMMIADNVLVYFPLAFPFAVLLEIGLGIARLRIAEDRRTGREA